MLLCCFTSGTDEDKAQSSEHTILHRDPTPVQDLSIKEQAKSYVPSWQRDKSAGPTTGRRAPSNAGRKGSSTTSDRRRKGEVRPSDYLYFGDGTSGDYVSNSGISQPRPQGGSSSGAGSTQPKPGYASGRDNSGYTATGLNNNSQMGYSNLTYGGSLQYDYAGTQPFGAGL